MLPIQDNKEAPFKLEDEHQFVTLAFYDYKLGEGLFSDSELGLTRYVPKTGEEKLVDKIVEDLLQEFDSRAETRVGKIGNLRIIFSKSLLTTLKKDIFSADIGKITEEELSKLVIDSLSYRLSPKNVTVHSTDASAQDYPSVFIDPRTVSINTPEQGYLDLYYTVEETYEKDYHKAEDDLENKVSALEEALNKLEEKVTGTSEATTTTSTTTDTPSSEAQPVASEATSEAPTASEASSSEAPAESQG